MIWTRPTEKEKKLFSGSIELPSVQQEDGEE